MNTSAIIRIVTWSVVVLVLAGILVMGLFGFPGQPSWLSSGFSSFGGYTYQHSDRYTAGGASLQADAISAIDIDWMSGSVDVTIYDGDTVTFSETAEQALAEKDQLHYYLDDGTLRIRFCGPMRWGFGMNQRKNLSILVPESMLLNALDVETVSSTVTVSGVNANHVGIETISGDTSLSSVRGNTLELETVSGGLQIEFSEFARVDTESVSGGIRAEGTFHSVSLSTVSGSVEITPGGFVEKIDTESVSGSVTVTLPPDIAGFTADIDSVSGGLTCDFFAKAFKNGAIYGDGSATLEFESVSGSVIIRSA
jgi:DUF4097 and DUF4098 domain-containing protein YvlB